MISTKQLLVEYGAEWKRDYQTIDMIQVSIGPWRFSFKIGQAADEVEQIILAAGIPCKYLTIERPPPPRKTKVYHPIQKRRINNEAQINHQTKLQLRCSSNS